MTLVLVFAACGAIGLVGWLLIRIPAETVKPVDAKAQEVSDAERLAQHQLRIEIGGLIQRGRIMQANMLSVGKRQIPDDHKVVASVVKDSLNWHLEVVRLTDANFGHAEAMRVSVPPAILQYPQGLDGLQKFKDGKGGGFDLRNAWGYVVGDLAALERFLAERPEIPPNLKPQSSTRDLVADPGAPHFDVLECGIWPVVADEAASKLVEPYQFIIGASFKIPDSRRKAARVTGRCVIAKGSLAEPPDIDGPLDYGYSEMRILNTKVQTVIPQNYPVAFIAISLDYLDPATGHHGSQRWYWKWPGSSKEGLFQGDFNNLSVAETDRFVSYLQTIHSDWTL